LIKKFDKRFLKKILITGHNGFIGSHLVKSLSNYNLIGISEKINKNNEITQIKKNITKLTIHDIPKDIFCIIHLAALTDVKFCQDNPKKCYDVNINGTLNILEITKQLGSKLIFVSTSHVYGKPKKVPINEDSTTHPESIYSGSKLAGEVLCESYSKSFDLDISILRLFSVYGPNAPQHLVTSRIISQLLTKNNISIGNTFPKRDFVFIDDVIKAIYMVLERSSGFNIFNIGSGKSHSILDLCTTLQKISGKKSTIKSIKSLKRKNETLEIVSNISKIKKLGWKPTTSFVNGLKKTYDAAQI